MPPKDEDQNKRREPDIAPGPRATRFFLGDDEMAVISFEPLGAAVDDARLTLAEREIAGLVLEGRSNAEISALRGTAVRTVANQLASMFSKLGIGSRHDLAAALRQKCPPQPIE